MNKLFFLFVSLFSFVISYAQCNLSGTAFSTKQVLCINSNASRTVNSVPSGRHIQVDVVKGFVYNIETSAATTGFNRKLTIFNASNTLVALASAAEGSNGTNGAGIYNWTAPFSGVLLVQLNDGACLATATNTDSIKVTYVTGNNTTDDQTAFGTDTWIGHVYNYSDTAAVPPSDAAAFAEYLGYYSIASENFNEQFGGNNACKTFTADGTTNTVNTETFAVKYRMRSTRPAGCYIVSFIGDDGVRLTIDGEKVFDRWVQQSPTGYTNVLVYLNGNSDLLFEYYEKNGLNQAGITILDFDYSSNTITATPTTTTTLCSNTALLLDGSVYTYNGTSINPSIGFQWQQSDDNITFTNISGATSEDYTPTKYSTSVDRTIYYRRIVFANAASAGSCRVPSNSVGITTTPTIGPNVPISAGGTNVNCTSFTANWAVAGTGTGVPLATGYFIDVSTSNTFTSYVPGYQNLDVGNVLSYTVTGLNIATTYYYRIRAYSATCSSTFNSTRNITTLNIPGTVGGNLAVYKDCNAFTAKWNAVSGASSYLLDVATDATFTTLVSGYSNLNVGNVTSFDVAVPPGTYYFRVKAQNSCGISAFYSSTTTYITSPAPVAAIASNKTCTAFTANWTAPAVTTVPAPTSYTIDVATNLAFTSFVTGYQDVVVGNVTSYTITGLTQNTTYYYRVRANNGCSTSLNSNTATTITLNITTPTIGTITQPTCVVATGSVVVNNLPSTGWILTPYLNGVAQTNVTGTGTTTTITNLPAGTYTFTVVNTATTCSSLTSANAVINAQPSIVTRPNVGTITHPTCSTATGSVVLSSLPTTAWTLTASPNTAGLTGLSGNTATTTIGGLTAGTTYTFTVNTGNCNSTASNNVVINVRPNVPTVPAIGTITQPTCSTATGSVALSGLPTTAWTITASPNTAGITGLSGSIATTTIGGLAANTAYTFTLRLTSSGCTVPFAVTTNAQPSIPNAPLISTIFGTSCPSNTGSVELTGLPAGSWTLTPYLGAVAQASISGSGTSSTVANLPLGSYTFTVSEATCTSPISAPAVVSDNSTTTWNGTAWSNLVPDESKIAIISGNYDMSTLANIDACSVIINSPAKITVAANKFLTIQNNLTVNSGATLDVLNQGSLVMLNDNGVVTNNGTTTIRKVTTPYEKFDYTYWSAPTATTIGGALSAWRQDYSFEFRTANFSDLNNDTFDDNQDAWVRVSQTTPMSAGKGYAIMAPTTGTFPTTREVVFTGKVNNGVITQNVSLSANNASDIDDNNLLGNPYPSAISADRFLDANPSLQGTIYLWTHVGNISATNAGPDALNFKTDDYAMYNFSGGVGVDPVGGNSANASNAKPTGYIASGQGFFAGVYDTTPIVFNNSMRGKSFNNTNFYRAADETASLEKDRIWLNLQNKDGMFSQQLIGYFDKATLGFDRGYDGIVSKTSNYVSFYSFIDQDIYRIQGRPAFNENDTVPLGYSSAVADTFTIAIDTKQGKLNNRSTNIYLEDKLLNVTHDLKQGPYSFTTAKGTFNDRFVLRYLSPTLGTNDLEALANEVKVALNNNQIQINSPKETMKEVRVYDVLGKLIIERKNVNSNELTIPTRAISQQTLLINITLTNGQKVTRKMIF